MKRFRIKGLFVVFFLNINLLLYSQESDFTPVNKDSVRGISLYKFSEKIIDEKLGRYTGDFKKDYKGIKAEQKKELKTIFERIFFHQEYHDYLKKIVRHIIHSNPTISENNINPYYLLDDEPNACSTGEGSIFINIGLLSILENEAELAFIIGHELAHDNQDHMEKSTNEFLNLFYSEENQENLAKINKKGLDRYTKLKDLSKGMIISSSLHSRTHEYESDSLSYEYLKNTTYNLNKAIYSIYRLKDADTEFFDMKNILIQAFNSDSCPFQERWIYKRESMGDRMKYKLTEEQKDSLRSHPHSEERYEKLKEMVKQGDIKYENVDFTISSQTFDKLKRDLRIQIVHYLMETKQISRAMYWIFRFQLDGEKRHYFYQKMYECLEIIQKKLENHTLGHYVERRNPFYMNEYNNLLIFIDNLNLSDIEKIKEAYKFKHNL